MVRIHQLEKAGILDKYCVQKGQRETVAAEGESFLGKSRKSLLNSEKKNFKVKSHQGLYTLSLDHQGLLLMEYGSKELN